MPGQGPCLVSPLSAWSPVTMTGWPPGSMPPSLSGHDSGVGGRQAPDALGARQPPRVFLVTFVSGTSRQDHQNMVLFAV